MQCTGLPNCVDGGQTWQRTDVDTAWAIGWTTRIHVLRSPAQQRTDIIFIEITAQVGFTDEQKQAAFTAIADELEQLGVERENLLFVILEVHGAAWHAPERAHA